MAYAGRPTMFDVRSVSGCPGCLQPEGCLVLLCDQRKDLCGRCWQRESLCPSCCGGLQGSRCRQDASGAAGPRHKTRVSGFAEVQPLPRTGSLAKVQPPPRTSSLAGAQYQASGVTKAQYQVAKAQSYPRAVSVASVQHQPRADDVANAQYHSNARSVAKVNWPQAGRAEAAPRGHRSPRRCRYGPEGCPAAPPPHLFDAHERDCGFQPTRCRICSRSLPLHELWIHAAHAHRDSVATDTIPDFVSNLILVQKDDSFFWAFKKDGKQYGYVGVGVDGVTASSNEYEFNVSVVTGDGCMACDFNAPVSSLSVCQVSKMFFEDDSVCTVEIYRRDNVMDGTLGID